MDKFINKYIKQYLFEEEEDLPNMLDYFEDEEKILKTNIDTDNRLKSAQVNPDERKIKETSIKKNKEKLNKIKTLKDELIAQQEMKKKQDQSKSAEIKQTGEVSASVSENVTAPIVRRSFSQESPLIRQEFNEQAPQITPPLKKKVVRVMFDKSSPNPFSVDFSERGFSIDGTRLSFEAIETALSKEFNIVLKHGSGLALDQVKMQKILKYKDRF